MVSEQKAAGAISEQQLAIIKLHIDHGLKSKDHIHPKTLFSEVKNSIEISDFAAFCKIVIACIKTGKLSGYNIGQMGNIYPEGTTPQVFTKALYSAEKPSYLAKNITIKMGDFSRDINISERGIHKLILNILSGKEDEDGSVQVLGKRYICDNVILERLLLYFF